MARKRESGSKGKTLQKLYIIMGIIIVISMVLALVLPYVLPKGGS